jgi:hypothetical protein
MGRHKPLSTLPAGMPSGHPPPISSWCRLHICDYSPGKKQEPGSGDMNYPGKMVTHIISSILLFVGRTRGLSTSRSKDHRPALPINRKIRFLHTSADVMYAFWVPELGMKKDAIAGHITETWAEIEREGVFRGQCAEFCGALQRA